MDKMEKIQRHEEEVEGFAFCALIKLFGPGSMSPEVKDVTF